MKGRRSEKAAAMDEKPLDEKPTNREELQFEQELAAALRPLSPPPGFADRVVARAAAESVPRSVGVPVRSRRRPLPFGAWRLVAGGAIAASLLAGSFAAERTRELRERARQQAIANQQFETASRITEQALLHTREQLERAGVLRQE